MTRNQRLVTAAVFPIWVVAPPILGLVCGLFNGCLVVVAIAVEVFGDAEKAERVMSRELTWNRP